MVAARFGRDRLAREQLREAGDLHRLAHRSLPGDDLQRHLAGAERRAQLEQPAEPGRVDEFDFAQVEPEPFAAFGGLRDCGAQVADVRQVDLAAGCDGGGAALTLRADGQVGTSGRPYFASKSGP